MMSLHCRFLFFPFLLISYGFTCYDILKVSVFTWVPLFSSDLNDTKLTIINHHQNKGTRHFAGFFFCLLACFCCFFDHGKEEEERIPKREIWWVLRNLELVCYTLQNWKKVWSFSDRGKKSKRSCCIFDLIEILFQHEN